MKFDKEEILKTKFGKKMCECATTWDVTLRRYSDPSIGSEDLRETVRNAALCRAKWEVFQLVLKEFYGVAYNLTRTDTYYGIASKDKADWLFREERGTA